MDPEHRSQSKKPTSDPPNELSILRHRIVVYFTWIVSMLLDLVFMIAWLATTWFLTWLNSILHLSSIIDVSTLFIYQLVFALSTLIPTVLYVTMDIITVWRQFRKHLNF